MATLHIPYYRSDVPVVRYTENINSGVMVIQEDENDHINYISGTLLTPTSNYFKTSDSQNTYSSILCKTNDDPSCLGSFDLPDKSNSGSYVLSYSNPTKDAKYTWTNIEDIALSKCFTSSTDTINATTGSKIISYNNSAFHFDNAKYVYNLLIDGYVDINKETTNDIVKKNENIFVLINDSSASDLSSITSENNAINLPLFYKYTANVTDTTATKKRLCKFIPDFKTSTTEKQTDICLTLITANMTNNAPNNIHSLKDLNIVCSVMITENRRIQ